MPIFDNITTLSKKIEMMLQQIWGKQVTKVIGCYVMHTNVYVCNHLISCVVKE